VAAAKERCPLGGEEDANRPYHSYYDNNQWEAESDLYISNRLKKQANRTHILTVLVTTVIKSVCY
jgi:hypothetical protein